MPDSTHIPSQNMRGKEEKQIRLRLQGEKKNSQDVPLGTRTEFFPLHLFQERGSFLTQMNTSG